MIFHAWMEGEDPTSGDGVIWSVETPKEAAEKHVDWIIIPWWVELGKPRKVVVHVQRHDTDDQVVSFEVPIRAEVVRGTSRELVKK